jgi:Icc-related predicted phosphoesterase
MKILVIGDIHNDIENMISYFDKLSEINFDIIVGTGDFTDVGVKGFSQKDIAKLILEEMKSLRKPIVCVPGNLDNEIISV